MPLDPERLHRAIEARHRLDQTNAEALLARDAFHDSVTELNKSGASLREIAEALDLSHQRVHQIIDGGGRPSFWARATRRAPRPRRPEQCSFCGLSQAEVRKLVAGPGIFICNDCISAGSRAVTGQASLAVEPSTFSLVNADARDTRCNFCGKQRSKVKAMATGTGGAICDQCLDLCQEVLVEDRASRP